MNGTGNESSAIGTNKEEDILSYDDYVIVQRLVNCGVIPVLLFVGVTTNVINCLVFYQQGLRDRMNLCLFCLAVIDGLYICTIFTVGSHCIVSWFDPDAGALLASYARGYVVIVNDGMMHTSALLSVVIAVERCLCVVYPMKAATIMTARTMGFLIAGTVIFVQLICSLDFLKTKLQMSYDADTGKMVSNWVLTDVYKNNKQLLDDVTIMFTTLALKIGTFVVIIAATALTVFKLKQAIAWRQNTSRDDRANRAQTSLAKMLVVISCVYIACAVPSVVTAIVRYLVDEFQPWGRYSYTALCTLMLAQVFTSVNSAVNFFVYFSRSSKFRDTLRRIIPCSKTREPKALKKSTFSDQTQLSSE